MLLAVFTVTVGNALPAPAEHVPCLGKNFLALQNSSAKYKIVILMYW
jgi:hypothetical protein